MATRAVKLTKKESKFVKLRDVGRLATIDASGFPHSVPICPVLVNGHVYLASETGAKKVRNIEANSHATLVFDVYSDSWKKLRGVMLQCEAHIVNSSEFKKRRAELYEKYPQYKKASPIEAADSVILELIPVKKFSWGF